MDEILQHPFFSGGYAIPKMLPASALYNPPSPSKSPKKSPFRSATAPSSPHQSKSPSRVPLSERTNTNTFPNTVTTNNFAPSTNNPSPYQYPSAPQTEGEDLDSSQSRKMRKIDRVKENGT